MVIVCSVRNSASPQELQRREGEGKRKAWRASIAIVRLCCPSPHHAWLG